MGKVKTIIKYTGKAVDGRAMDVVDLAPSLMALSELLTIANQKFNGNEAGLTVLINADLEQNCFELGIELAQNILATLAPFLQGSQIRTAKEIAEWVGIIGAPSISLYGLIKKLKGKKIKNVKKITQEDGKTKVEININAPVSGDVIIGDQNTKEEKIVVDEEVFKLYADKNARKKAVEALKPLNKDGYDGLEFHDADKVFEKFTKAETPKPDCSDCPDVAPQNIQKYKIQATVRIKKAAYEGDSKWTLIYKKAIEASMEDKDWLDKFQNNEIEAPPGTDLEVDLEEIVEIDERGEAIGQPAYIVRKVKDTILREDQPTLYDNLDDK